MVFKMISRLYLFEKQSHLSPIAKRVKQQKIFKNAARGGFENFMLLLASGRLDDPSTRRGTRRRARRRSGKHNEAVGWERRRRNDDKVKPH